MSKTHQIKHTQMVATATVGLRFTCLVFRLLRIEHYETIAQKDVRFKPEPSQGNLVQWVLIF